MKNGMKHMAFISLLAASVGFASAAYGQDASPADCIHLAQQVSNAISSAAPGQKTDQARQIARQARGFCSVRMYEKGTTLYTRALDLLNAKH